MAELRESVAGSERRKAQHDYVDANGNSVDSIEKAAGNRYVSKSGFERTWLTGLEPGSKGAMLAAFGARTLMINTTSGARQNDEAEDENLDDRYGQLENGVWRERAEGTIRGPKYDKAILAQAIVAVLGDKAQGDAAHYQARLEDPETGKAYYAKVRTKTPIMAKYLELAPQDDTGVDSIA